MLAVTKAKSEKGLSLLEAPEPRISSSDSVLLKVRACGICGSDMSLYRWGEAQARFLGAYLPVIIGHEVCGEVVERGSAVDSVEVGDRVVFEPHISCGKCPQCAAGRTNICTNRVYFGAQINGGMAEYCSVPSSVVYKAPASMSDSEASIIETLGVAVHGMERMPVTAGNSVAVLGAGSLGLLAMQCAKAAGAYPIIVTGTSRSQGRLERARQLGADATIVADEEDVARRIKELTSGQGVDQVFEAAGTGKAILQAVEIARRGGQVCLLGATSEPVVINWSETILPKELDIIPVAGRTASAWHRSLTLAATGKVKLGPLIDRELPLEDALEGFRLLEDTRDIMKVVIKP